MTKIGELIEAQEFEGDAELIGRGLFTGFIAYIEQVKNEAYHAGMRDGLLLNKKAIKAAERQRILNLKVADLELTVRSLNVLAAAGVTTIDGLLALDRDTVMRWKGAGTKTWREILDTQDWIKGTNR